MTIEEKWFIKIFMDKVERIKALENGKGIQYLLDSAYKIFNNPIYVIDVNYNLLAFTDVPVNDPIWKELVSTGTYSMESLELLANEGIIEDVANARRSVILKSDKIKYTRISDHFCNRDNISVGLVVMYECNMPFDAECVTAFEALTEQITNEIHDHDYFITLAMTFYDDKINKLLDRTIKDPIINNPHVQILYDDFNDYIYVAVVSVERKNILENVHRNRLAYFKSFLKTKYQSFKFSVYSDFIVMLMSSKYKAFNGTPFFAANAALFKQNGLFLGVSGSFENMYELRKYYDQAVATLENGLAGKSGQRYFLYNGA